jgi:hypothetical protein
VRRPDGRLGIDVGGISTGAIARFLGEAGD